MEAVDEFVTPDEAAAMLDVARDRIDVMVEEGLLQPVAVDTEVWFSPRRGGGASSPGRLTCRTIQPREHYDRRPGRRGTRDREL